MSIAFQAPMFRFGHYINIGDQRDCFPAPVPSGKAIFALQKHSRVVFFLKRPAPYTFVMAGGEKSKSIGKALLLDGFLSYLGSHSLHTYAVLLRKN